MHIAIELVALITGAAILATIAQRVGISAPLVLTLAGVVASYLPFVPETRLSEEVVLVGLLPPLLYAAAIRTSLVDFRRDFRSIALLSVGLVAFTTVGIGLLTWYLLPGVPLAEALALGAVVAPPDAVAATAIARKVGMPRRVVTILEGESLVNDATAIVLLRTAVIAIGGTVTVWQVGWSFLLSAGGGVAVGVAVAFVMALGRRRVTDPVLDTVLSFAAPFIAYVAAEAIHGSGVLAVVVTGLLLGHKAPVIQTAASRIAERTNWRTVQFVLENSVFLLIGLQTRAILSDVASTDLGLGRAIAVALAVLAGVIVLRPAWVFPVTYVGRLVPRGRETAATPWQIPALISWAGMRGVVTLAAVFVIPESVPYHSVLVFIALVVVGGTLLVQGSTLPWVVRRLGISGPDPSEDALQAAVVYQQAARAGLRRLDELAADGDADLPPQLLADLRARSETRANALWERLGRGGDLPSLRYAALRVQMLEAERTELLRIRDTGTVDDEILADVLAALDVEESILERIQLDSAERDEVLTARPHPEGSCEHLDAAPRTTQPKHAGVCDSCAAEGLQWVHLRMCLTCGNVACCDSSVGKHAARHFRDSGHPVMRSVEPGEAWRWCYVDERTG